MRTHSYLHILLIIILLPIGSLAQNTGNYRIIGALTDQNDGNPAAWELVELNGEKRLSDENGRFEFAVPGPGNYLLVAGGLNYERLEIKEIEVTLEKTVADLGTLKLAEKSLTLPVTTILAGMDRVNSGTVITSEDIKQRQPLGTEEMLKTAPAVVVAGDMGISNRLNVGIRGSYPRRSGKILLLEDGSPIAPAPYLGPEAYYNPPSERIDGIEVIKGADLVAYGPQTMYGAVNYITHKPPMKPRLLLTLTAGENDYYSGYLAYGGTWNNTGAEIQLLRKHFGGFQHNTASDITNLTGKVFTFLNEKNSIYAKINLHSEVSQATYSGLTPYTFNLDPKQNPFDADILSSTRYALDLRHNLLISEKLVLSTSFYGHSFVRDWWRQNTTMVRASDVQTYLGEDIFNGRYQYLSGADFTSDDWVRVGKISGGKESTLARNRTFAIAGLTSRIKYKYGQNNKHEFESGVTLHRETFLNQEFSNDSTRFANAGTDVLDELYTLWAPSLFARNKFIFGKLVVTPALRVEYVYMTRFNRLAAANDPDFDPAGDEYQSTNRFPVVLPGLNLQYEWLRNEEKGTSLKTYAGIYRGYTPPTNEVGFNAVNEEGIVTSTTADSLINMKPETSLNHEAGVQSMISGFLGAEATWFMQDISNFYAAGRREAFETLGRVRIYGTEFGLNFDAGKWMKKSRHKLGACFTATWMQSRILSGVLTDTDLLKAKHNEATRTEMAEKINENPEGFEVYFAASDGSDSLVSRTFTSADVSSMKKVSLFPGQAGNLQAPYVPNLTLSAQVRYEFQRFNAGVTFTYVGKQFTDYFNLENETSDGAMGSLPAYTNLDANAGYTFHLGKQRKLTLFLAGKNITNQVYRASRLHRVSSGIMPGGFRQLNGGLTFEF